MPATFISISLVCNIIDPVVKKKKETFVVNKWLVVSIRQYVRVNIREKVFLYPVKNVK